MIERVDRLVSLEPRSVCYARSSQNRLCELRVGANRSVFIRSRSDFMKSDSKASEFGDLAYEILIGAVSVNLRYLE